MSRSAEFSAGIDHAKLDLDPSWQRPAAVDRRSRVPDGPKTLHETLEDEYERKWSQGYDD